MQKRDKRLISTCILYPLLFVLEVHKSTRPCTFPIPVPILAYLCFIAMHISSSKTTYSPVTDICCCIVRILQHVRRSQRCMRTRQNYMRNTPIPLRTVSGIEIQTISLGSTIKRLSKRSFTRTEFYYQRTKKLFLH